MQFDERKAVRNAGRSGAGLQLWQILSSKAKTDSRRARCDQAPLVPVRRWPRAGHGPEHPASDGVGKTEEALGDALAENQVLLPLSGQRARRAFDEACGDEGPDRARYSRDGMGAHIPSPTATSSPI